MPSIPVFTNLAGSTLAFPVTNVATTATLASGTGALFPNPTAGQFFSLTLINAANDTIREIVFVTARSGDVITMVRGREGTTALAWNAGDKAEHFLSALPTQIMAQPQFYNATLQTQIGGYSLGTIVASVTTPGTVWQSTTQGNLTNPDAGGAGWIHPLLDQTNTWTGVNTHTNNVVLYNNVVLQGRDTFTAPRPMLAYASDNNVTMWTGLSGAWRVVNFAGTNTLLSLDNSGNLSATGSVTSGTGSNVTAGYRLRATVGAYLSGDPAAATIMNDFPVGYTGGANGYTRLPNGVIMNFGVAPGPNAPNGISAVMPFPLAMSGVNTLVITPVVLGTATQSAYVYSVSGSGFQFTSTLGGPTPHYYFAVGN